jgi:hypothetical protein
MKNLYLVRINRHGRRCYALGVPGDGGRLPADTEAVSTGTLAGRLWSLHGTPVPVPKGAAKVLDHVGSFQNDDEFFELLEGINAEPIGEPTDIDEEDVA